MTTFQKAFAFPSLQGYRGNCATSLTSDPEQAHDDPIWRAFSASELEHSLHTWKKKRKSARLEEQYFQTMV